MKNNGSSKVKSNAFGQQHRKCGLELIFTDTSILQNMTKKKFSSIWEKL